MAGRPSLWKDSYVEELVTLMQSGYTDVAICAKWSISRDTFYRWLKEKKELKNSYDIGIVKSQDFWEQVGTKGMIGEIRGFQAPMWDRLMRAKFRDYKEEKKEGVQVGTINVLNNFSDMTTDNLLKFIDSKTKRLNLEAQDATRFEEPEPERIDRVSPGDTHLRVEESD